MIFSDDLLLLVPLLLVAFWGLLVAFTDSYNIKMLVSWYQSIEMQRIVLPVKFDGGLYISVLRNMQLLTKKIGGSKTDQFSKSSNFQTFKSRLLEKVPLFLDLNFLANEIDNLPSNFTDNTM
jgi:hypothetical protein